ncbi:unnamed protein product [Thlaspi arvense]|uniref:Uncharacterized protein n=1 Tax=Thlaspi arvense TaxID=13288 RepID=A0AAU9SFQ7_THLAR|nr:unnamed protein product [Thlaspi arvense]
MDWTEDAMIKERQRERERDERSDARGKPKGSMDRTRRHTSGGGRKIRIGLNRTGKSCRLRWVNYLHPGLKRGKMTPQEERLVLELHAKWGNRWSKIARKLPGRTDNEIKNYWRTHTRKKAQEKKRPVSPTSSFSNCCSSSMTTTNTQDVSFQSRKTSGKVSFYDTGGSSNEAKNQETGDDGYSLDDIWREIDHSAVNIINPVKDIYSEQSHCLSYPTIASPSWESSLDSIWKMDADKIGHHGRQSE